MTDITVSRPPPQEAGQVLDRRLVAVLVALGAAMYLASVGVVRLLDYLSVRAQTAQLVQEGGPLSPVACQDCTTTGAAALVWLTDWRALLLWSLVAGGALIAVLVVLRRSRSAG